MYRTQCYSESNFVQLTSTIQRFPVIFTISRASDIWSALLVDIEMVLAMTGNILIQTERKTSENRAVANGKKLFRDRQSKESLHLFPRHTTSKQNRTSPIGKHTVKHHSRSGFQTSLWLCEECGTTKTPVRRGGPSGPSSLCNACGLRHKKREKARCKMSSRNNVLDFPNSFSGSNALLSQRFLSPMEDHSDKNMEMQIESSLQSCSVTTHITNTDNVEECDSTHCPPKSCIQKNVLNGKCTMTEEKAGAGIFCINGRRNKYLCWANMGSCEDFAIKDVVCMDESTDKMDDNKSLNGRVLSDKNAFQSSAKALGSGPNTVILSSVDGDEMCLDLSDEFSRHIGDDWRPDGLGLDTDGLMTESIGPHRLLYNMVTDGIDPEFDALNPEWWQESFWMSTKKVDDVSTNYIFGTELVVTNGCFFDKSERSATEEMHELQEFREKVTDFGTTETALLREKEMEKRLTQIVR